MTEHEFANLRADDLASGSRVVAFEGVESLCRPYLFSIHLQIMDDELVGDLADAVGSEATLTLQRREQQQLVFNGVLSRVSLAHHEGQWGLYEVHLVPRLWQLGLTRHSRVFTQRTVPEIIEEVLAEAGLGSDSYDLRLTGSYRTEELVVMYGESKLDFLHRWMEREGIYYYFEQGEGVETIVITDHVEGHRALLDEGIPYRPTGGVDASAGECFDSFAMIHDATVSQIGLADRDYGRPLLDVSATSAVSPQGTGSQRVHAGRFFDPEQAKRYVAIRAEALRSREVTYHASGSALHMSAGYLVQLVEHGQERFNKRYLVREVHHFGNFTGSDDAVLRGLVRPRHPETYRVALRAVDADRAFRMEEATPWPRVWGYEGATVDGEADSAYAQIDDDGRYFVSFHFGESELGDGKRSTAVRMMQPHGGGTEGFHCPLRKGTEVIVAFLGGDPDRPVIAGVVPNALTPSPVTSENNTQNIIQTGGENLILIEDRKSDEFIFLRTPPEKTFIHIGNEKTESDSGNIVLSTQGHMVFDANSQLVDIGGGGVKEYVKGDVYEHYFGSYLHKVDGDETRVVGGDETISVTGSRMDIVNGSVDETHQSSHTTLIGADHEHSVMGDQTLFVSGSQKDSVGGDVTHHVSGDVTQTVSGDVVVSASSVKTTTSGPFYQHVSADKFEVTNASKYAATFGTSVELKLSVDVGVAVGMKLQSNAGMFVTSTAGANITHAAGVMAAFGSAADLRQSPLVVESSPVWTRTGSLTHLGSAQILVTGVLTVL